MLQTACILATEVMHTETQTREVVRVPYMLLSRLLLSHGRLCQACCCDVQSKQKGALHRPNIEKASSILQDIHSSLAGAEAHLPALGEYAVSARPYIAMRCPPVF